MPGKKSTQDHLRDLQKLGDPRKITTEQFKRPDHNDFATTGELRERKFNGWRANSMSEQLELWVNGEIIDRVNRTGDQTIDKMAMDIVMRSHFGMD